MRSTNNFLMILIFIVLSNQRNFPQSITWIDSSEFPFSRAYDVSDDGSTVVGDYIAYQPTMHHRAFRWIRNQGFIDLGTLPGLDAHAYGVSGDGKIIVGNAMDYISNIIGRAFFWTDTTGLIDIGTLGGDCAIAHDISADGTTIVGESEDSTYGILMAFRRLQNGEMDNLGSFCNGCLSRAKAVSSDGSVIVGEAEYGTYHNAFIWTSSLGLQDIGRLGGYQSEANGVSEDGSIVVGITDVYHPNGTRSHAFKWTQTNGMIDIHSDSVGSGFSNAFSVSADGKKIVGIIYCGPNIYRAFLWTEEAGMKKLDQLLSNIITYGSALMYATKITPDGRFIVGYGYNSSTGRSSAYIIDTQPAVIVEDKKDTLSPLLEFKLIQNYPNPFNPSTTISWQSPESGHQTIKLFDILGNEIETIVDGYYDAGYHSTLYIVNSTLSSGVYFYQLRAGKFVQTKKMLYLK